MAEFRLPERRAIIVLDDGDYAGAEVSVSLRIPMGVLRDLSGFEAMDATQLGKLDHVRDLFVKWARPTWNLADADGPIPPTIEGMERLLPAEVGMIVGAWLRGVVEPPAPLPRRRSSPTPSPRPRSRPSS